MPTYILRCEKCGSLSEVFATGFAAIERLLKVWSCESCGGREYVKLPAKSYWHFGGALRRFKG